MATKVCFICYHRYGDISLPDVVEISACLARKGFIVDVVALGEGGTKCPAPNLTVVPISVRPRLGKFAKLQFLSNVASFLRRTTSDYDIVHAYYAPLISLMPLFLLRRCEKWLLDIRTVAVQGGVSAALRNFLCGLESLLFDGICIIDRRILDRFYLPKHRGTRLLELPIGVDPDLFRSVSNSERLKLKKESQFADSRVLIYVGRMDKARNLANLIQAFSLLKNSTNLSNVVLLMVGDGEDKERLRQLSRDYYGMGERVIFTGMVSYERVNHYLSLSDIALSYIPINATYNYQPPLKTLEYLCNNIPLVATATEGNKLYITDGVNGLLADDSPSGFASRIQILLNDQSLRERISGNCSKGLEKHYWSQIVESRLIPFYRELLK